MSGLNRTLLDSSMYVPQEWCEQLKEISQEYEWDTGLQELDTFVEKLLNLLKQQDFEISDNKRKYEDLYDNFQELKREFNEPQVADYTSIGKFMSVINNALFYYVPDEWCMRLKNISHDYEWSHKDFFVKEFVDKLLDHLEQKSVEIDDLQRKVGELESSIHSLEPNGGWRY